MTGSTSATSSAAVGAVELREVATRLGSKNGRKGKMAKLTGSSTKPLVWPEMDRSNDGVEGDLRRRRIGRGRCGGLGRCERSGLGCSMKWIAGELLDTMRGRTDDGEHSYDEGTTMVASAMAGEREGEELERRGGVWGVRGSERG